MRRHELEHLIRAAGRITDEYEFVVVGSQAVLGTLERPPAECTLSDEADIFPLNAESKSDLIDAMLGEGSQFHETHGFYAQGVDSKTATLPEGWKERLVRLQSAGTEGRVAHCLDVVDLFLSKCYANREKDRDFNRALLAHGFVTLDAALKGLPDMPVSSSRRTSMEMLIRRLASDAQASGLG